jgi:hypothetical protein
MVIIFLMDNVVDNDDTTNATGINGPEKEPEYVSLTVPGQSSGCGGITGIAPNQNQVPSQRNGIINWENLCDQTKSLHEHFIQEDCDDLAHGTQFTSERVRVISCVKSSKSRVSILFLIKSFA